MEKFDSYEKLISPLLEALHWKGQSRQVHEAMPYKEGNALDLQDLRDILARLGYVSKRISFKKAMSSNYPLLHIAEDHAAILHSQQDLTEIASKKAFLLCFSFKDEYRQSPYMHVSPLWAEIQRFRPALRSILAISLIIGAISLVPILYNKMIYDHLIAAGTSNGFTMLFIGVLIALAGELGLRQLRNRKLALFGGRIDHYVSNLVFQRLLLLPPIYTERSSTSSQLARLRDFESVRDFFTGPLSSLVFEFPLVIIYLIAMVCISGWLSIVPLCLIISYVILIAYMNSTLKMSSRIAATMSVKRQEFLLEMITKMRDIRLAGMEKMWVERHKLIASQASVASFNSAHNAQILEAASYALMILGGAATLTLGVILAIGNQMTTGALVASMMLIWRIIAPLQLACASLTRIQQLSSSTKQVERLISVPPEPDTTSSTTKIPNLSGTISFHRVSLRYGPDTEAALLGVNFEVKPGQIVAIKGSNGSGKSSLLKLVLGLYQPQAGSVRIGGIDIRQFNPQALRQSIAYVPQNGDFFPGTIRENLLMSYPEATEDNIKQALEDACIYDEVMDLPQGIDTVIQVGNHSLISFTLSQNLNLARGYICKSSIYLFDEVSNSLGQQYDQAFANKLKSLRGNSTVIMVTHRQDQMLLADNLYVINKGELTHAGEPQKVLTVLKGKIA